MISRSFLIYLGVGLHHIVASHQKQRHNDTPMCIIAECRGLRQFSETIHSDNG
jgi:hypothetical protein